MLKPLTPVLTVDFHTHARADFCVGVCVWRGGGGWFGWREAFALFSQGFVFPRLVFFVLFEKSFFG